MVQSASMMGCSACDEIDQQVIITATLGYSDGTHDRVSVEGVDYEDARTKLKALVAEDQKLLVIRTDNY
ncbi:hypothetical protein CXZ05_20525 [Arthrobacter sp. AFG20]|nr:hypothetical protein CXZ05_20525 [Arthrobacter sp. AFG20]